MRRVLLYLAAVVVGVSIGGGLAVHLASLAGASDAIGSNVDLEGWRGDFAIGSSDADPYTRARVARHGLLALARTEAVYLTRARDDAGRPLIERCSYRLSGGAIPAQWWSVTLYDASSFLPKNRDEALSFDATRAGEGPWSVIVSPNRPNNGSAWISSRNAGQFDLTLRMYIPDPALIDAPGQTLNAPSLKRIGCDGGGA